MFRLTQWLPFGMTSFEVWREHLTAQGIAWELRKRNGKVALFREGRELFSEDRRRDRARMDEGLQEADSVVICSSNDVKESRDDGPFVSRARPRDGSLQTD